MKVLPASRLSSVSSGYFTSKVRLFAGGGAAQVLGELGHRVLAADFHQHFVHVDGLPFAFLGLAVERYLGEVAIGQRPAFDRVETRVLLAARDSTPARLLRR